MKGIAATLASFIIVAWCAPRTTAQSRPLVAPEAAPTYQHLLRQISQIRIFDHHAHPGFADDPDVDPAPVPAGALPPRPTPGNPGWGGGPPAFFGGTAKTQLKKQKP